MCLVVYKLYMSQILIQCERDNERLKQINNISEFLSSKNNHQVYTLKLVNNYGLSDIIIPIRL